MILMLLQILGGDNYSGVLPESAEVLLAGIFFIILAAVARKAIKKSTQTRQNDLEKTIS